MLHGLQPPNTDFSMSEMHLLIIAVDVDILRGFLEHGSNIILVLHVEYTEALVLIHHSIGICHRNVKRISQVFLAHGKFSRAADLLIFRDDDVINGGYFHSYIKLRTSEY